jgi:hypothetical protein
MKETPWIIERNRLEETKIKQLFCDTIEDENIEIPDDDPRWKELNRYLDQIEKEHKTQDYAEESLINKDTLNLKNVQ